MTNSHESYVTEFSRHDVSIYPSWLQSLKRRAIKRFTNVGMPIARRGNERWKYTNVRAIARSMFNVATPYKPCTKEHESIKENVFWDESWINLVFIDGHYSQELSAVPSEIDREMVNPLVKCLNRKQSSIKDILASQAEIQTDDGFASLNTAFFSDGAFVNIPSHVQVKTPINLVFLTGTTSKPDSEPTASYPRVLVHAASGSKATLIESYVNLGTQKSFVNTVAEILIDEGAEINHCRIMIESPKGFHIGTTRVRMNRDSVFNSLSFAHGSQIGRNDLHVMMDERGAQCDLNGLYMTNGKSHLDNHINVTHDARDTTSRQFFKGILTDKSRAVFSGIVLVKPDAQKTFATQKDMNLLLSRGAEVDTKPSLLIYADDVQCQHGATAGEMDENALFYMLSRGINKEIAQRMLIHSFASEIIQKINPTSLRSQIDKFVSELSPKFQYERFE